MANIKKEGIPAPISRIFSVVELSLNLVQDSTNAQERWHSCSADCDCCAKSGFLAVAEAQSILEEVVDCLRTLKLCRPHACHEEVRNTVSGQSAQVLV